MSRADRCRFPADYPRTPKFSPTASPTMVFPSSASSSPIVGALAQEPPADGPPGSALGGSTSPCHFRRPARMTQPQGRAWADYTPTTPGAALKIFGFFGSDADGPHGGGASPARSAIVRSVPSSDEVQENDTTCTNADSPCAATQASTTEESSDQSGDSPMSPTKPRCRSVDGSDGVDASELPSVGSALHDGKGGCRPCAWFWKSGCINGTLCRHCHLCPQGEYKRRKEEKREQFAMNGVVIRRKKNKKPKAACSTSDV